MWNDELGLVPHGQSSLTTVGSSSAWTVTKGTVTQFKDGEGPACRPHKAHDTVWSGPAKAELNAH